jgi:hypothetical protein
VYFYFHSKAAILSELAVSELTGLTKQLKATSSRDAAERAAAAAEAFATAHAIFNMDFDSPGREPGLRARTARPPDLALPDSERTA